MTDPLPTQEPQQEPQTVWVEDRRWRVVTWQGTPCSFPRCHGAAVAAMDRQRGSGTAVYHYCASHLYGRRVEGGKVLCQVSADSPAARRGYVYQ